MKRLRVLVVIIIVLFCSVAGAEVPDEAWVLCRKEVNIRRSPTRHSEVISVAESGYYIELTGKKVGRWYQCDVPCEAGVGWIRGDYLVFDKPVNYAGGKLMWTSRKNVYARYSIRGNKCAKLRKGTKVMVYMMSEEWSVTSRGFIMTKFLEEIEPDEEM